MSIEANDHLGFITKNFMPDPKGSLGGITRTARSVRNTLVGWADDIPVLNIGADIVRAII